MRRTRQVRKARRAGKVRSPKLKRWRTLKPKSLLCDTLSEVAVRIYNRYRNPDGSSQLQYDVSKQVVSDWKHGRRLDGAPPPPPRVNARQYDGQQWLDWFERYMLAKWKIGAVNSNGHVNADDIRAMKQEDEKEKLLQNKWEREKERGLFMPIDEHNRIATEFGIILNNAITEHGERELSSVLIERVNTLALSYEQKQVVISLIKEGTLLASDNLRTAIKRQVISAQLKAEAGQ